MVCASVVGEQEIVKFNRLLTAMSASLTDLQKAIKGLIVMTLDLDKMYTSFLTNKVPGLWYVPTASFIQGTPSPYLLYVPFYDHPN